MKIAFGLSFPGTLQDESIICDICKKFDINVNIIEASFSMSAGWAILRVEGTRKEIEKAFDYLARREVKIQNIETTK